MSTSVLPQLLEVDSELSAQATVLQAKLSELQEKRKGIQTVISMFESGETPAAEISPILEATTTTKTATKKTAAGARTTGKRKATDTSETASAKPKATRGRPAKAAKKKATIKSSKATVSKRSGRTADWQRYVQGTYKKSPLPDVIVGVLQAQPENVFKIADVMNVVFKEGMPRSQFLKARNRISNILSAGARDGVWHRGRGGTYSMSEKAIKAG